MLQKDISSTACELTMLILSISVTFNVTCLTYIFNYKIMPATLANTFLIILQDSAVASLRYGGRLYRLTHSVHCCKIIIRLS